MKTKLLLCLLVVGCQEAPKFQYGDYVVWKKPNGRHHFFECDQQGTVDDYVAGDYIVLFKCTRLEGPFTYGIPGNELLGVNSK